MHHQRRKSGPGSGNTSMTDVRKAVAATDLSKHKRPGMTRRHTPSNPQKLGRAHRERSDAWDHDERESFPQFCMTCEKQFVPHDDMFLYCSDACRQMDQNSPSQAATVRSYTTAGYDYYPYYSADRPEPRDIIPRASPSRPSSLHFNHSPPASPDTTLSQQHHTSAMSALRSLTVRPPSPTSPSGSSGIWPFSRSAATSPSNSYTRPSPSGFFPSTYDVGYGGSGAGGFAYSQESGSGGVDRPLPSRYPGGYSRSKSIELVTPMISR